MPIGFTWAGLPTYKKLPLKRGLGNSKVSQKMKALTLSSLNKFSSKSVVDLESLLKLNLISKKDVKRGVKILGGGKLEQSLIVKLPVSNKVKIEIEKKGGKVNNV